MMQLRRLKEDTFIFVFDELAPYLTTVTVLVRRKHLFIFDTFLGERYMQQILSFLDSSAAGLEVIVINSHSHFDHVWGNNLFSNATIFSSALCCDNLRLHGMEEIRANAVYRDETLSLCLPNRVLHGPIDFAADGISVFPSPGHTADSVSLMDYDNSILLVGDNIERPLIQIEAHDLNAYLVTLQNYLQLKAKYIIGGHNAELTQNDISETIQYLEAIQDNQPLCFSDSRAASVHQSNLAFLADKKELHTNH